MKWRGVIAVEGEHTVDGRFIEQDALNWDLDEPLPVVQWIDGTYDWNRIGWIETIERDGGLIRATGTLDTKPVGNACEMGADSMVLSDDETPHVQEARIRYVAIGERPAWPQCTEFVIEDES